ncbi:MAG: hypothetical protein ACLQVD_04085 [Capsulimonadaceae bacterium]
MLGFLRGNILAGRIPLWNPYMFCGAPFAGNPQVWALYPSSLLLLFFRPGTALSGMVAVHVWLAGWGMYVFLRRGAGLRTPASVFGAIVFMFGGQLVSKEQFPNMVQAAAYCPWVLFGVGRLVQRPKVRTGTGLGVILGLQLLAGHAQMVLLTLYLGLFQGVFCLIRGHFRLRNVAYLRDLARSLVVVAVTAAGLSAGELLPILECLRNATHGDLTFKDVNRFFLPANQLLNFVVPALHGHPIDGNFRARGNFWETCCYIGWLPAFCAAFAVAIRLARFVRVRIPQLPLRLRGGPGRGRSPSTHPSTDSKPAPDDGDASELSPCAERSALRVVERGALPERSGGGTSRDDHLGAVRLWVAVFAAGVGLAMGGRTGLYRAAYAVLPGFRSFHDPARCLLWAAVAVSVLSAIGLQNVLRKVAGEAGRKSTIRRRLLAAAALILAFADLCHFGRSVYPVKAVADIDAVMAAGTAAHAAADPAISAGTARVLAPDTARDWVRFTAYRSYRQGILDFNARWKETMTPNLPMTYGVRQAFGYDPVGLRDPLAVLTDVDGDFDSSAPPVRRGCATMAAGVYSVRYVVTDRVCPPEGDAGDAVIPGLVPVMREATIPLLRGQNRDGWISLSRNMSWQPRARLVSDAIACPTVAAGLLAVRAAIVGSAPLNLRRVVVLAGPGSAHAAAVLRSVPRSIARRAARGKVRIVDDGPDRVAVDVTTSSPGVLLLADTLAPGWSATLDGRRAHIIVADGFVRAVLLPRGGANRVIFTYRPESFALGLYISLLTLAVLAGVAARLRFAGRLRPV